ncbi:polymorphic outer membrane protein repeat (3 repeats) [Anaerostipes sp. CAG:276]|nr:polymorphic outer membrane protein repeat (3 repeats) [Anaerostipes sp. CAG:276]
MKYNHPPVIKAHDLGYFDQELSDAEKVLQEIQKNPVVTDKEDDEQGKKLEAVICDPEKFGKEEVKNLHRGTQAIIYSATDSLGKTSTLKVQVYIAGSNPYENAPLRYSRFISKKFLNTLDENSRWRTKEEYKEALETSLNRTEPVMTVEFQSGSTN